MSASGAPIAHPPAPVKPPPSITVTRTGPALFCKINGKSYKITNLQRMLPGSNQWQNMDVDDPEAVKTLGALVASIERLVDRIGPEQFDLRGAKSFQVLAKRQVSTNGTPLPFTFHEIVWKPPGAEEHVHFKLKLENFAPTAHAGLETGMASVGRGFAEAMTVSKVKPSSTKSNGKKKAESNNHSSEFMTHMPTDGNCMLHSVAHQLRHLSTAKRTALAADGIDASLSQNQLVPILRQRMAQYISTSLKFRNNISLIAIIAAVREEGAALQARFNAARPAEQKRLQPQLDALNEIIAVRGFPANVNAELPAPAQCTAIIQAYAAYIGNDGIYLDQISIEALADVLDLPIAVIEPEIQPQQLSDGRRVQVPTGDNQISECFSPPQEARRLPRGIEDPETLFVYYHGRGDGSKHYDHVNPAHQQTRTLVRLHKESCAAELRRVLAGCNSADPQVDINRLLDPISVIRKYYPELIPQIHAYLVTLGIDELDANRDGDIAQMLLQARATARFDFDVMLAVIKMAQLSRAGIIDFYDERDPATEWMGNFYRFPITYRGVQYQNVEAAFQAQKFTHDRGIMRQFETLTGQAAFELARQTQLTDQQLKDWEARKVQVMGELLTEKAQDPRIQALLLATGGAYLNEHNPKSGRDAFWSDNYDGTGQNMLGRLWMQVRGILHGGTGEVANPRAALSSPSSSVSSSSPHVGPKIGLVESDNDLD